MVNNYTPAFIQLLLMVIDKQISKFNVENNIMFINFQIKHKNVFFYNDSYVILWFYISYFMYILYFTVFMYYICSIYFTLSMLPIYFLNVIRSHKNVYRS